jgi:hypothetical protein
MTPPRYLTRSRSIFGALLAVLFTSGSALAQTPHSLIDAQDLDLDGVVDAESPALPEASVEGASAVRWPGSCDIGRPPIGPPYPYCITGFGTGLTLRPASEGLPDLLGFLTQTAGSEDIVWLDVDDMSQEIGRCSPGGQLTIGAMAYNGRSLCGRSDTLFVTNGTTGSGSIIELAANVGEVTSERACIGPSRGEATVAGAESCEVLRVFGFAGLPGSRVGALVVADPPSLGRTVLVVSKGALIFVAPDSPACDAETVDIVHTCPIDATALAWMGGDRFLVVDRLIDQVSILDIKGGGCEIAGSFQLSGSNIAAVAYDRDRELLYVAEEGFDALNAYSLDPVDRNPVANAGRDQVVECVGGRGSEWADGRRSCDPDDPLNYTWTALGTEYLDEAFYFDLPLGSNTIQLEVDDGRGGSDRDSFDVEVVDRRPPEIFGISANPAELWPPNGKLVPVTVDVQVDDLCDLEPSCAIVGVKSSEPVNGEEPDWELRSSLEVALRAAREGEEDRTYTLSIACTDETGWSTSDTVVVPVLHDSPRVPPHTGLGPCPCWSREELESIAPNPDTDPWSQSCQIGDGQRPDTDSIIRQSGRRSHRVFAESGSGVGEYQCRYNSFFVPNLPRENRTLSIDEKTYEFCRDQIRVRQWRLGFTDQCTST